jgi:tubulin-folding cofactor B
LQITDTRPPGARPDFGDLSSVEKYTLPAETYETMSNTVLSWKKQQKLGRFDPDAATPEEMLKEQVEKEKAEIEKRGRVI